MYTKQILQTEKTGKCAMVYIHQSGHSVMSIHNSKIEPIFK
jgi:hypothetical protein